MDKDSTLKIGGDEAPANKLIKGGLIGAVLGIPAPFIGSIVGGLIGAGYMWSKHKRKRS